METKRTLNNTLVIKHNCYLYPLEITDQFVKWLKVIVLVSYLTIEYVFINFDAIIPLSFLTNVCVLRHHKNCSS